MPTTHEYPIPVTDLDAGGKEYRFPVRAAWLRGVLEGHEATSAGTDGDLAVRASRSGHDVVVHGTLDARLTVPCARCLEPAELPVHAELSVLYIPASKMKGQAGGGEGELSEEEADTLPFEGDTVALDDLVRDELLLEIPMIPLCSEDCPGMSPAPGQGSGDKPIDPRLAPLLAFSQKKRAT
jgi:uncharacterized protein